jgi:hypothetical protein
LDGAVAFLNRQGHWHDLASAAATALDAARRLGDRGGEAHAHYSLGIACLGLGRGREGRARLERAVDLYRKLGDTTRQARGVLAVGEVLRQQGRHAAGRREASRRCACTPAAPTRSRATGAPCASCARSPTGWNKPGSWLASATRIPPWATGARPVAPGTVAVSRGAGRPRAALRQL